MTKSEDIAVQFAKVGASADDEIELARAALLIAATEYPQLDIDAELAALDSLAAGASRRLGEGRDPLFCVNTLSDYLFDELGIHGNQEDYYDPRNSFLNEVLSRRLGIPISLSLLYIEVGKRLEVPLVGVGMPGHFMVRHREVEDLFIDPFHGGLLLSEEECSQRLSQVTGAIVPWDSRYVAPVANREFIARMLRNLKAIYMAQGDSSRALTMIDWLLALQPQAVHERRDRGLVHYELGHYPQALDDLQGYLDSTPDSSDSEQLRELVSQLRRFLEG